MDIIQTPARELGESAQHVENVVRLLDEGNTLPLHRPLLWKVTLLCL